ncbi:MAG: xanthine dehydrogenase family protein molybdopterin-binding subunit [Burkholderiales bacterium]
MSAALDPQSPLRKEDARLLQGRARYVDNVHLDRMVHATFVRSPVAHARIRSIDATQALAAGALRVLTAKDLSFNDKPWIVRYWHPSIRNGMPKFLATDRVRYVGEPIAVVIAEDRYRAEDLAALVDVQYEALTVVHSVDTAIAPGAPSLHEEWPNNVAADFQHKRGDADAAMAKARHRVRRRFHVARQTPMPLEPRGVVAEFDEERDSLTVWMSTQAHYNVRQNLATILDLPEHQVRVIAEDVGGGFGAKSRAYPEEIVVSHASRVLRRPVKWIEDRFENLQATTHSRAAYIDLELGCDQHGRLVALKALLTVDIGGYIFTSGIVTAEAAAGHLPNAYKIADLTIDVRCVGTNKTPVATYRGAGQPEAAFPTECLIDVLAKEVGITALELRQRNIVMPADLPYHAGTSVMSFPVRFESGDFAKMVTQAVADSGYSENVETGASGERIAWGMACAIEGAGFVNIETAHIRVDASGHVTVLSGMTTQGQGQLTTYAQVCAETLGVEFDRVSVRMGDTQLVPFGRGAFASRGAIFGGNAVLGAALALRAKVLDAAAKLLECDAATLTMTNCVIRKLDGTSTPLTLGDVVSALGPGGKLFAGEPVLEARYVYTADQPLTYGMSVHATKVAVNPRTGFYRLLDYLVVHDAGRSLNPTIVAGQIVGGVVDGIGGAMYSEMVYDDSGQPLTGTLADYLVAVAPEMPRIRLSHMETRPTTNPLGVRGIGEGGVIPTAAAITNAIARAIEPSRAGHEVPLFALPLRPEKVFEALKLAR